MDHIPVHIGTVALKRMLYNVVITRWNKWTNEYLLHIDQITMQDKLWVILNPTVPDCDVIKKHFFKTGKKGNRVFKSGKTVIHFYVPTEIYNTMVEKRQIDERPPEKNTETWRETWRKMAGR